MGKRRRLIAARTAFEAMLEAGGDGPQLIACLAGLERKERPIHAACVGVVEAGNPQKVIEVLEKQGAVPPPPRTTSPRCPVANRPVGSPGRRSSYGGGIAAMLWPFDGVGGGAFALLCAAMGLRLLRWVGLLEGLSFVLLLFIAMPLKYVWDQPLAVRYVGIAHGVLFVLLVSLVLQVGPSHGWSWKRCAAGVAAAFVPFGPFFFDRTVKHAIEEAA